MLPSPQSGMTCKSASADSVGLQKQKDGLEYCVVWCSCTLAQDGVCDW